MTECMNTSALTSSLLETLSNQFFYFEQESAINPKLTLEGLEQTIKEIVEDEMCYVQVHPSRLLAKMIDDYGSGRSWKEIQKELESCWTDPNTRAYDDIIDQMYSENILNDGPFRLGHFLCLMRTMYKYRNNMP